MKQLRILLPLCLLLIVGLLACSGTTEQDVADVVQTAESVATEINVGAATEEPEVEEPEVEEPAPSDDVITLEFWHAMGGDLGPVVDQLVAEFNASQDDIVVNVTYQGSYDDTYGALLAAFETGTEPNIVQNFDLASQTMFDTGRLVPAHTLMAEDNYDPSIFVDAVREYYSDDEGMVAMAFNSSTPILYYNEDIFAEAGVEPPPDGESWSFSEVLAACDTIQESGAAEHCFAYGQVGWYFEQILANSGGFYFNNNNGRTGRATEVMFNQGVGVEVFEFLSGLVANGYSPNLGNTWTDTDAVFLAGEAAMMFDSTAGAPGLQENASFPVGTMFIPYADSAGDRSGVVIGGAALWLIDSGDPAENQAAWEFMKFMAEADQQVTWHTNTGYFPVRTDLADNPTLQSYWDENPNLRTAIEQLATTETELPDGSTNYAVLGGRAGPFPAIRRFIVEAYSSVLDDGMTAQEALDIAAEKANQELEDYNEFFNE